MKSKNTILSKFTVFDLVIIGIISALGVATKPIIVPLVHIITGPLFIPGGAIAGGFYMLWIAIGIGYVKKFGTGILIGIVQGILVIVTGTMGTHGIMSMISYTLPGLATDLVFSLSKNKKYNILHYVFGCMAANVTGTLISNILFFRLPWITLILLLSTAALSGALGGLIALSLVKSIEKLNIDL
ncbi:MAG: ECF transporter S component [Tissierellia bacterium]|jgi:energy-coupling factor transport system substrate-specific component|nr:ECF transporter S component [Tissierellia bacterium]